MKVKIKKLNEKAVIPTYAHATDAGLDLTAVSVKRDSAKDIYIYGTGLAIEIPKGYVGLLFPRSSNRNTEAYMTNHVGIIDSGYRGEVMVCYKTRTARTICDNLGDVITDFYETQSSCEERDITQFVEDMLKDGRNAIKAPYSIGDRIAQLIIIPYLSVELEKVEELTETERGDGGFGSTGTK